VVLAAWNNEIAGQGSSLGRPPGKERFWPENASVTARQHESAVKLPVGERYAVCRRPHSNSGFAACRFREGSYAGPKGVVQKSAKASDKAMAAKTFDRDVGAGGRLSQWSERWLMY
jgi:hypothetical protein